VIFTPFDKQARFLQSQARIRVAAASKRSGKSEVGAIESIIHLETRPGWTESSVDPYIGVIIAPTSDMLRRLSMKKILGFAKPFRPEVNETRQEITWHNGSIAYGISADRPERLEGIKANFIFLDEAFQMEEQIFLESMARVADTRGKIWITGSLGVQYRNPRSHWIHRHFKEKPIADSELFEWTTSDNPHFPKEELERLKDTLDPITYRQMFEICWDTQGSNLVYDTFGSQNLIANYQYNPKLETYVSIDWGWNCPAVALYIQYDQKIDTAYLFDEIVGSKITLESLYEKMAAKPYHITKLFCDIAGNQEREQTGISNIQWFRQPPRNMHFTYRTSAIAHGISVVRSYILNSRGQRRLYIDDKSCPKTVDALRNYQYDQKHGELSELPNKKHSDCPDALRYFFVNRLDYTRHQNQLQEFNRWAVHK